MPETSYPEGAANSSPCVEEARPARMRLTRSADVVLALTATTDPLTPGQEANSPKHPTNLSRLLDPATAASRSQGNHPLCSLLLWFRCLLAAHSFCYTN